MRQDLHAASLVHEGACDSGQRFRLEPQVWAALGIAYHRPVRVTAHSTPSSLPTGAWSFICVSSLRTPGHDRGTCALDPRVVIPPAGVAATSVRAHLQQAAFQASVKAWPSAAVNAAALQVQASPGLLGLPLLQVKLHQTLITPGCYILLGGKQFIRVLAAEPAPARSVKEPLYRIVASTRIAFVAEGEPHIAAPERRQQALQSASEGSAFQPDLPDTASEGSTSSTRHSASSTSSGARDKAAPLSGKRSSGKGKKSETIPVQQQQQKQQQRGKGHGAKRVEQEEEEDEEEECGGAGLSNSGFGLLSSLQED